MRQHTTPKQNLACLAKPLVRAFIFLLASHLLHPGLGLPQPLDSSVDATNLHYQQWKWFHDQRAFPFEKIRQGARQRAMHQHKLLRKKRKVPSRGWLPIGPAPLQSGGAAASGRITTLAFDPTDPTIVYIGAAQGGVWQSTDAGVTWTPLTDSQCSLAMGALAVDPVTPTIIYAGTGEQNASGDSYYGCGVLQSSDGGTTWTQLGADIFGHSHISKVLVDPSTAGTTTSTTIYVAAASGLYQSFDSGATFTQILDAICCVTDLVIDPTNPAILYAAGLGSVYKSIDAGITWSQTALPGGGARVSLAIAPSSPLTLYAAVNAGVLHLLKTTDGGESWTQISAVGLFCEPQCWYNLVVAVDPTNPDTVYFGGILLFRSTDGGASWSNIFCAVDFSSCLHADQHALGFDVLGQLYVGNDGGVWRTSDGGAHWDNLNTTLAITQFYPGMSLHPTDSNLALGGTQDNGTIKYSGSLVWQAVGGGDGGFTAIDFKNPNTAYGEFQWSGGPWRCDNFQDTTGFCANIKNNGIDSTDRALFIPPLIMDPSNSNTLLFGTSRVYRTIDRAESWSVISPPLTNGAISALAIAPTASSTIYVGTNIGEIFTTSTGGGGWTNISAGLPGRYVTALAVDPSNPATVYVTVSGFGSGHVFQTTNFGAAWTDIRADLPDIPCNAIVMDAMASPPALYIGTDLGVFLSVDGGVSWQSFDQGFPNVAVFGLTLNSGTGTLLAGTHGRGAFQVTLGLLNKSRTVPGSSSSTHSTVK